MTARAKLLTLVAVSAIVAGCDSGTLGVAPPGAPAERTAAGVSGSGPSAVATVNGMTRTPLTGTIASVSVEAPGRLIITPSGRCHFFDDPVNNFFNGDVTGAVTFHENEHAPCDLTSVQGSGPFDGQVTWNGRTGMMAGQWTTNCTADPSQPIGLSCGGVMNARGSGGLEGVQFHFEWGPGWYPFAYTGTAFSQ